MDRHWLKSYPEGVTHDILYSGVFECATICITDERLGEAIKVVVFKKIPH